ncbi:hypothetical protein, partial [Parvimonas micra]|uniref:hypothetical protein n=1 Tax=Parvimonas micra TaxID=33033 RepID=UPI002B47C1B3
QDTDGVPLAAKRRETFALVASNTPAAASTLFGGLYVLNQSCTGYGTLILRYRSADGSTMINLLSKSVADNAGGTMLQFGAGQVVDATVSGTTACNATLSRIQQ